MIAAFLAFGRRDPESNEALEPGEIEGEPEALAATMVACEVISLRYDALIEMLRNGDIEAQGTTVFGHRDVILRSIWSRPDFYVEPLRGDLLQAHSASDIQSHWYLKHWIGLVLRKTETGSTNSAEVSAETERMSHVKPAGHDQLPSDATECDEQGAFPTDRVRTTTNAAYRACVEWVEELIRENPERGPTKDALWTNAQRKWPAKLSQRAFLAARDEAIRDSGPNNWAQGGRPKKT